MTEAKDWLVLTLDSQNEPIRIQKTLFKLAQEAGLPRVEQYEFQPYNWGPFSSAIYQDIDALISDGLAQRVPRPEASWGNYALTPQGRQVAVKLRAQVDRRALQHLSRVSDWVEKRPFAKLLADLYEDYPEMAKNSLFKT